MEFTPRSLFRSYWLENVWGGGGGGGGGRESRRSLINTARKLLWSSSQTLPRCIYGFWNGTGEGVGNGAVALESVCACM